MDYVMRIKERGEVGMMIYAQSGGVSWLRRIS